MSWTKIFLSNILVFIIIVVSAEIGVGLVKLSIGRNYLLPQQIITSADDLDPSHPCLEMKTDVMLAHVNNHQDACDIKDGRAIGEYVVYDVSDDTKRIVLTLGGSTTSGFYKHYAEGNTWPNYLSNMLSDDFYVVNGGAGSYSAMQEFLKFYRDGSRFKNLSMVISLNGINEQPHYFGRDFERRSLYPFSTQIQYRMNQSQQWIDQRINSSILNWKIFSLIPNIRSLITNLRYLDEDSIKQTSTISELFNPVSAAERWERNVRSLNALVSLDGAKYFLFLQPTLGILGPQSEPPKNTNDEKLFNSLSEEYLNEMRTLYKELKDRCARLDFCIDISDAVTPTGNVYFDPRHHNMIGNKLLAEEILFTIKEDL